MYIIKKLAIFLLLSLITIYSQSQKHTIIGKVTNPITNEVVSNVIVYALSDSINILGMALADRNGNFKISNIDANNIFIKATKLGYTDFISTQLLLPSNTLEYNITLTPKDLLMNEVSVTAERPDPILSTNGFFWRKKNLSGTFLTEADININARSIRNILRDIRGIHVDPYGLLNSRGDEIIVYLDGMLITTSYIGKNSLFKARFKVPPHQPGGDHERMVKEMEARKYLDLSSSSIKAIEFYSSHINAPSQFVPPVFAGGVLVIWTK